MSSFLQQRAINNLTQNLRNEVETDKLFLVNQDVPPVPLIDKLWQSNDILYWNGDILATSTNPSVLSVNFQTADTNGNVNLTRSLNSFTMNSSLFVSGTTTLQGVLNSSAITNVSTINGNPYPVLQPEYWNLSGNALLNVSSNTLLVNNSISTTNLSSLNGTISNLNSLNITNVSTINGNPYPVLQPEYWNLSGNALLNVSSNSVFVNSFLNVSGSTKITGTLNTNAISNLSTINGNVFELDAGAYYFASVSQAFVSANQYRLEYTTRINEKITRPTAFQFQVENAGVYFWSLDMRWSSATTGDGYIQINSTGNTIGNIAGGAQPFTLYPLTFSGRNFNWMATLPANELITITFGTAGTLNPVLHSGNLSVFRLDTPTLITETIAGSSNWELLGNTLLNSVGNVVQINDTLSVPTIEAVSSLNVLSITGLSTINGNAYPVLQPEYWNLSGNALLNVSSSSLLVNNSISTTNLSSLYGTISNLNSLNITNVSTINGNAYPPPVADEFFSLVGNTLSNVSGSSLLINNTIEALNGKITSLTSLNITGVSTINGNAYPPPSPASNLLFYAKINADGTTDFIKKTINNNITWSLVNSFPNQSYLFGIDNYTNTQIAVVGTPIQIPDNQLMLSFTIQQPPYISGETTLCQYCLFNPTLSNPQNAVCLNSDHYISVFVI